MFERASREALAGLAGLIGPAPAARAAGLAARLEDARVAVLYQNAHGLGEYVLDAAAAPRAVVAEATDELIVEGVTSASADPFTWYLRLDGIKRVLSLPVADSEPATRLWAGFGDGSASSSEQLRPIAAGWTGLARMHRPTDQSLARLERLDLVAASLPELVRVLDVREIFERLSEIAQVALPHDMLTLGLFADDYSTLTMYARTGQGDDLGREHSQPYPPDVVCSWRYDVIDNRSAHPLERDRPPTRLGMQSSLRLAILADGRVIGGLGFNARAARRFSMVDVEVGRRLADQVAVALSHQRLANQLAEQARHAEGLLARAAKSELLDEVLSSITTAGALPHVFDRISKAVQSVLGHDAMFLAVRLPDGKRARIYASAVSPGDTPIPETVDVPAPLLADPDWQFNLVDDLQADPSQRDLWTSQQGYRSTLRLPFRLDNEFLGGLSFLSRTPGFYQPGDVAAGARIADRIALSFAAERGAVLMKRADEARAEVARLEARVKSLTDELDERTGHRHAVGASRAWREVLTQAAQVAETDATVLLVGESGTGKEVVARFLHRASARRAGPYVALNCAALPEQLLEAELFGFERGAFTGATQSKPGRLEQAAGGTLVLDEVGEMSLAVQAKFLRVLQEREFTRLGATRTLRADVRVIAATNRDLHRAIATGQFREDLFYRLNVFAIRLPPLRERRGDVMPLVEAFLEELGRSLARPPAGISRDARQRLLEYDWPGNVRELRNIVERAAILCGGGLITAQHLAFDAGPARPPSAVAEPLTAPRAAAGVEPADLQSIERAMIAQALERYRFNKSKAAKALGLSRQQLYLRLRRHGLE